MLDYDPSLLEDQDIFISKPKLLTIGLKSSNHIEYDQLP